MGEGFIVRRGGGGQQTAKPIYNSFEAGFTSLTLNVTNDSGSIATLYYSVVNNEPGPDQAGTFDTEFAGKETKDITITGLTQGTTYTVYLRAIVIGEFPSETVIVSNLATLALIYTAATGGTTQEYNLDSKRYKSHTFTTNGTFQVTTVGNGDRNQVEYLIVAGGGASGGNGGAGGGAGGYRSSVVGELSGANSAAESKVTVTAQSYSIVIGGGGATLSSPGGFSQAGANSSGLGITSTGGGGGGQGGNGAAAGGPGGSGGGGASYSSETPRNGGAGTSGQGFAGGNSNSSTTAFASAGGGGAGQAGPAVTNSAGYTAAAGLPSKIRTGVNIYYAGGGRGYNLYNNRTINSNGGGPAANIGHGGHLSTDTTNGSSGIVVIRYEIAPV